MFRNIYEVKITGKDVKRFIKKLYRNNIYIEDIDINYKYAYLKLSKDNYEKLLKIKTIYKIEVIKLYGFIKVIDIIKRHYIFIIMMFLGYIYLIFLSNIIFKVEVIHSKKDIRALLYNELRLNGIEKYNFVKNYEKKEKISSDILEKHKDKLEWLEIERIGSVYKIRVEERVIKLPKKEEKPRDIVAKKDGIIMKIKAQKGEVVKKINDYVKKGDVIISGSIRKGEEVKNKVSAEGSVYAEVWYKSSINMPFYYKDEKLTGKTKKTLKLRIIDKDLYFFNFNKYKTYKENKIFNISNRLLPIRFTFSEELETIVDEHIYSYEGALKEATKRSKEKIESTLNENERILKEKVLKVNEYENYINVSIFYKVYEDITDEADIKEINEEDKKDKKKT